MTALYPGAVYLPVPNHGGPLVGRRGLVLHVQQGNGALANYFGRPSVEASSHWWVGLNGAVQQYVDADLQAWAQADGNADWHSVETEGYATQPMTIPQLRALASLYAWGRNRYGWPLQTTETPAGRGFGWHGMGGQAWGNHPGCPGTQRRQQRATILRMVADAESRDDMTKDDIKDAVREVLAEHLIQDDDTAAGGRISVLTAIYRAYSQARQANGKLP